MDKRNTVKQRNAKGRNQPQASLPVIHLIQSAKKHIFSNVSCPEKENIPQRIENTRHIHSEQPVTYFSQTCKAHTNNCNHYI